MPPDDLLPYPLAGSDSGPEPGGAGAGPAEPPVGRPRRWPLPAALALIVALAVVAAWSLQQWRVQRDRVGQLEQQLAAAQKAAEIAEEAAVDAVRDPLTLRQVASSEMHMASDGVGRFLEQARYPAQTGPPILVAAFFGVQMRTSGWTPLPSLNGTTGVLAKVDDPLRPTTIWVSARSTRTIDISIPSKQNCLELDIDRIIESAANGRAWGRGADSAPLRWWSDVYDFVAEEACGA